MKVVTIKIEDLGWDLLVALVSLLHTVEHCDDDLPGEIAAAASKARTAVETWADRPFE